MIVWQPLVESLNCSLLLKVNCQMVFIIRKNVAIISDKEFRLIVSFHLVEKYGSADSSLTAKFK